jgi:hypothetical protein
MEEDAMTRREELLDIINKTGSKNDIKAGQLVEQIIFLEKQMSELRQLPFIKVDAENPMKQKATPAAKMYKETLQQYNNSLRLLFRLSGDMTGDAEEESPLRLWAKARMENDAD